MECKEIIKAAVSEYMNGESRSLECLGFTLDDEISCKVYYINKNEGSIEMVEPFSVVRKFVEEKEKMEGLSFFDFSQRGEDTYSVSFRVEGEYAQDLAPHPEEIEEMVACFGTRKVPLIQLGYLLKGGEVVETKYYYTLNSQNQPRDARKRLAVFESGFDKIKGFLLRCFGNGCGVEETKKAIKCGYRPFMLGINEGEKREDKLYFIINDSLNYYDKGLELLRALGVEDRMRAIIECCDENGLFLRGFALSEGDKGMIFRFYCFPKK